jgi:hypothetical protein
VVLGLVEVSAPTAETTELLEPSSELTETAWFSDAVYQRHGPLSLLKNKGDKGNIQLHQ